jgi:membrane-associated phospholipid phosphatase
MNNSKLAARLLFGIAGVAAFGFGALSVAVARGKLSRWDRRAKREAHRVRGHGRRAELVRVAAQGSAPLGKWWAYLPGSLFTSFELLRRRRGAGAFAVAGAAVGAALLPPLVDRTLSKRRPPPERGEPSVQSYPSGHALQTSAVALATSYVLWRERLGPRWAAAPLSIASLTAGAGKLLLDRHWTSDLLGGYCAGVAWGAACAGAYELVR